MKIIEVIAITPHDLPAVYACRNQQEANLIIGMIQEQGGIPMQGVAEVPEGFDRFALDPVGAFEEACMN
jgi:pantothenate kinase-related protein Tda10